MKLKKFPMPMFLMALYAVLVCIGFILQTATFSMPQVEASSERTYYARVLIENIYFYATPTVDGEGVFQIEPTYFVELIGSEDEDFYIARYLDQSGYVKKKEVSPVSGTPQKPYVQGVYATVLSGGDSVYLRTAPTKAATWDYKIPDGETNIQYYGKAAGQEVINGNPNWFFVKYYTDNTIARTGYIYSHFCTFSVPISPNQEVMTALTTPLFNEENAGDGSESPSFGGMPLYLQILIVVAVCVPCFLILYLLFKPTRMATQAFEGSGIVAGGAVKRMIRKPRRDYYEMDD